MPTDDHRDGPHPPVGDLRLLDDPVVAQLLRRAIPARVAYVARDATPRLVPTWFHWDGHDVVMATWVSGPHVRRPAHRLADLVERPDVTVSIDTDDQPPTILQIRGRVDVRTVDGVPDEYRLAAKRYLGPAAEEYLAGLDGAGVSMARISMRPTWVNLIDFDGRPPRALAA